MDAADSTWQIIAGSISAAGAFVAVVWRNRKAIGERIGAAKDLFVKPLTILDQLAQQAERDRLAAEDRKEFVRRLDKQDDALKRLLAELSPNGGSSVKDIVKATNELALYTHQMTVVSEARIRLLQAMAAVCIYECDSRTGECVWVNEGICKLFDLQQHEMLGFGWMQAIDHKEREGVKHAWESAVKGGYPYSWEYTIVRKDGTRRKVLAKAHELRDKTGKSLLFQGTVEAIN